jgi:hypothetical protein
MAMSEFPPDFQRQVDAAREEARRAEQNRQEQDANERSANDSFESEVSTLRQLARHVAERAKASEVPISVKPPSGILSRIFRKGAPPSDTGGWLLGSVFDDEEAPRPEVKDLYLSSLGVVLSWDGVLVEWRLNSISKEVDYRQLTTQQLTTLLAKFAAENKL